MAAALGPCDGAGMKVLLVDDHPVYRDGLTALVMQLFDDARVEQVGDAAAMFERLESDPSVDLLLLDLSIPGLDGRAALPMLRTRFPAVPVVVVSASDDAETAAACMAQGASGFIPKSVRRDALAAALQAVLDGAVYLSPVPQSRPPAAAAAGLTPREVDVLRRLAVGESNKEIARKLEISEATVRAHCTAVFRCLGVASRTQALLEATRRGLIGA